MKIVIFGATGMVGKQLVQQSLFNGNHVRAFGRNVYTTDYLQTDNLELVQGALFSESEVFRAIEGCDAVVSSIGGSKDGLDKARTLGLKNIIEQMDKAGVKRFVGIGGMGILNASDRMKIMEEKTFPPEHLAVSMEHLKALEQLEESKLDWTFVCPSMIKNEGPTGAFKTAANHLPEPNNDRINAGDLALFMLNELVRSEFVRQRVGISN